MAPFCERRAAGSWPASKSVHHIRGAAKYPNLAYVDANTCPVCSQCHSKVEAMERNGKPTQAMFEGWNA